MIYKVGDKVTVRDHAWLPNSCLERKDSREFIVVFINYSESVVIDTTILEAGWPRTSIGEGTYWNIGTCSITKVINKNLIGGKLL